MRQQPLTRFSLAFPLQQSGIDASQLLNDFDFVSLSNGGTKITAAKSSIGGGGTTSIQGAGGAKLFTTNSASNQGTVSYQGQGNKFFTTNGANTSTSVTTGIQAGGSGAGSLKLTQTAVASNQSLANKLSNFSTMQWLLIGGVAAAGVLLFVVVRK